MLFRAVHASDRILGLVGSLVDSGGGGGGGGDALAPTTHTDGVVVVVTSDFKGDVVIVVDSSGGVVLAERVGCISTDVNSTESCGRMARSKDGITATLQEAGSVWLSVPSGLVPIAYGAVNEKLPCE